jgi:hypothetical protein
MLLLLLLLLLLRRLNQKHSIKQVVAMPGAAL